MGKHKLKEQRLVPQATAQAIQLALPSKEPLERLARSLDEFGSNVAGIAVRKQNEAAEAERERGRQAALEAIAKGARTEKELVDAKIIERGEGAFFRDGVMEQSGRAFAADFSNAVIIEAAERGLQDSLDPDEMREVLEDVSKKFDVSKRGEAFAAGFGEAAANVALGFEQRHATQVAANIENEHTDGVTNKYRGIGQQALEGVDPEFVASNLIDALTQASIEHLAIIPDVNRNDRQTSNKALVDALISFLNDGSITGPQAREVLDALPTAKGGFLGGIAKHSNRIEEAIDNQINRSTLRDAHQARLELKRRKENGTIAMKEIWLNADDKGRIDIQPLIDAQAASGGRKFTRAYMEQAMQMAANLEAQAAKDYLSDPLWVREYIRRILDGETVRPEEISGHIVEGELSAPDGVNIARMAIEFSERAATNPVEAAMLADYTNLVKTGLGGFSGREFGSQAWARVGFEFQKAFNEIRIAHPEWTASTPEFRNWQLKRLEYFQLNHLSRSEWGLLQREADLRTAIFETRLYQDNIYAESPQQAINLYAEALEMQDNGTIPTDKLLAFFNEPGRQLSEEGALNANNYVVGMEGQLFQMEIEVDDSRLAAARRALQFRPRAGTEAGTSTEIPLRLAPGDTIKTEEDIAVLTGKTPKKKKTDPIFDLKFKVDSDGVIRAIKPKNEQ